MLYVVMYRRAGERDWEMLRDGRNDGLWGNEFNALAHAQEWKSTHPTYTVAVGQIIKLYKDVAATVKYDMAMKVVR